MKRTIKKIEDALDAGGWDITHLRRMLRDLAEKRPTAKHPRKMALEYIRSAGGALAEARKAAMKLPTK